MRTSPPVRPWMAHGVNWRQLGHGAAGSGDWPPTSWTKVCVVTYSAARCGGERLDPPNRALEVVAREAVTAPAIGSEVPKGRDSALGGLGTEYESLARRDHPRNRHGRE